MRKGVLAASVVLTVCLSLLIIWQMRRGGEPLSPTVGTPAAGKRLAAASQWSRVAQEAAATLEGLAASVRSLGDANRSDGEQLKAFYADLERSVAELAASEPRFQSALTALEEELAQSSVGELARDRHRQFVAQTSAERARLEQLYRQLLADREALVVGEAGSVFPAAVLARDREARFQMAEHLAELEALLPDPAPQAFPDLSDDQPEQGPLPWRNSAAEPREPRTRADLAGAAGSRQLARSAAPDYLPVAADTAQTLDTELIPELADLAASLDHDPVAIYQWVLNTIAFEPYYGSAKGAAKTYWDKAGNDVDTASLLIALLRASDIPARYVYGTVRLSAAQANNLFGTDSAVTAATILARGGTPARWDGFELLVEKAWVEAYVGYDNYRGSGSGPGGEIWVPLDPSFKTYTYSEGIEAAKDVPFDWKAFFENGVTTKTTVEIWQEQIAAHVEANYPGRTVDDVPIRRSIVPENLGILPLSLPYPIEVVHERWATLPDSLRHKVRYKVFTEEETAGLDVLFAPSTTPTALDITLPTAHILHRPTVLGWVGATAEDQEILDWYGGVYATPAYLVQLRPVLRVDGEILAQGDPAAVRDTVYFRQYAILPEGVVLQRSLPGDAEVYTVVRSSVEAGEPVGVGHGFQGYSAEYLRKQLDVLFAGEGRRSYDDVLGQIAYINICYWFYKVYGSDQRAAALRHVWNTHNRVSFGVVHVKNNSATFMGAVGGVTPRGFATDVPSYGWTTTPLHLETLNNEFSRLVGCAVSQYEGLIYTDLYGMPPISAVSVIQRAYETGVPVDNGWTDQDPASDDIYVLGGVAYHDWFGMAHISNNSGEGGYVITGGLNGGASAVSLGAAFPAEEYYLPARDSTANLIAAVYGFLPVGAFQLEEFDFTSDTPGASLSVRATLNPDTPYAERVAAQYPYLEDWETGAVDITRALFTIGWREQGEYLLRAEFEQTLELLAEIGLATYVTDTTLYLYTPVTPQVALFHDPVSGVAYAPDATGTIYAPRGVVSDWLPIDAYEVLAVFSGEARLDAAGGNLTGIGADADGSYTVYLRASDDIRRVTLEVADPAVAASPVFQDPDSVTYGPDADGVLYASAELVASWQMEPEVTLLGVYQDGERLEPGLQAITQPGVYRVEYLLDTFHALELHVATPAYAGEALFVDLAGNPQLADAGGTLYALAADVAGWQPEAAVTPLAVYQGAALLGSDLSGIHGAGTYLVYCEVNGELLYATLHVPSAVPGDQVFEHITRNETYGPDPNGNLYVRAGEDIAANWLPLADEVQLRSVALGGVNLGSDLTAIPGQGSYVVIYEKAAEVRYLTLHLADPATAGLPIFVASAGYAANAAGNLYALEDVLNTWQLAGDVELQAVQQDGVLLGTGKSSIPGPGEYRLYFTRSGGNRHATLTVASDTIRAEAALADASTFNPIPYLPDVAGTVYAPLATLASWEAAAGVDALLAVCRGADYVAADLAGVPAAGSYLVYYAVDGDVRHQVLRVAEAAVAASPVFEDDKDAQLTYAADPAGDLYATLDLIDTWQAVPGVVTPMAVYVDGNPLPGLLGGISSTGQYPVYFEQVVGQETQLRHLTLHVADQALAWDPVFIDAVTSVTYGPDGNGELYATAQRVAGWDLDSEVTVLAVYQGGTRLANGLADVVAAGDYQLYFDKGGFEYHAVLRIAEPAPAATAVFSDSDGELHTPDAAGELYTIPGEVTGWLPLGEVSQLEVFQDGLRLAGGMSAVQSEGSYAIYYEQGGAFRQVTLHVAEQVAAGTAVLQTTTLSFICYVSVNGSVFATPAHVANLQAAPGYTLVKVFEADFSELGGLAGISATGTYRIYLQDTANGLYWVDLQVGELDLDIDSDNSDGFNVPPTWVRSTAEDAVEADPARPGKIVVVNTNDDDGDEVPDYAGGLSGGGTIGEQFTPLVLELPGGIDVNVATIQISYDASDPALAGGAPDYLLPATGHLRIWRVDGAAARDPASVGTLGGGDFVASGTYTVASLGFTAAPSSITLYVEAVKSSAAVGASDVQVELDPDGSGPVATTHQDAVILTAVSVGLVADVNRDLVIDDADRLLQYSEPLRFWVNDDDDINAADGDDVPGDCSRDALPGACSRDAEAVGVDSVRDLVDFFPVFLEIQPPLTGLASDPGYTYRLHHPDNAVNFAYTGLTRAEALDYHSQLFSGRFGDTFAEAAGSAATHRVVDTGYDLSPVFLAGVRDSGWGVLLIEGREETTAPLILKLERNGTLLAQAELPIRVNPVEDMFRHVDLTGDMTEYDGTTITPPETAGSERTGDPGDPWPDRLTNGKYFVFVHGYNVDGQQARGWHSEIFKRLHAIGSNVRFVGVSWHGATGRDYHKAVYQAFQTGDGLGDALTFAPAGADVTVAAHSLGNMVVSHAIQIGRFSPTRYYMLNAAVPVEAYDFSTLEEEEWQDMVEEGWKAFPTPVLDDNWRFFSANWHELSAHTPDDRRNELSWKDRFVRVRQQIEVHNFYSPGEDVVANMEGVDSASMLSALWREGLEAVFRGRGSWKAQELMKGVRWWTSLGAVVMERNQGGWGYNLLPDLTPTISASDEELRSVPFFRRFLEAKLMGSDQNLASTLAGEPRVQYDILARGIPALSYAAAANQISAFGDERNFDMEAWGRTAGAWPTEGHTEDDTRGRWLHSDLKNVALPYVWPMFEAMIVKGALR